MKNSIFIWAYPNTEEKIQILKECLFSLRKTGIPLIVVSNMLIPSEISSLADRCLIGQNEECSYHDFFTPEEIDEARNSCKYLLHFIPPGGDDISYRPFYYGKGTTYHWSTLTQNILTLKDAKDKNISRILILEGDVILDTEDLRRIPDFFSSLDDEGLDFIVSIQHIMGNMSGNGWFTTTEYWERVCSRFSTENFLRTTYPNWSAESYVLERMKIEGGKGKILTWDPDSFVPSNYPKEWITDKELIPDGINSPRSINLFFPMTKKIGLSSSTDRKDQSPEDPLTYVPMGIGKRLDLPVFFIWNRYNGETVKEIKAKISVFNGASQIFNSEYNLFPGGWVWSPIFNLKKDSHCTVEIVVVGVNGEEFHFSDRFGSVGNSINMRDLIPE